MKLKDVRHVTGLKKNVISLRVLELKGCSFTATSGVLRVCRGDGGVLQGKKVGQLYRLEGSVWTGGATVRHGTTGTGKKQGKRGARRSQQRTWNRRRRNQGAQGDSPARTEATEGVLGLLEVYRKAQSTETRLKLYNASDHGNDQETSPICSRFDQ